LYINPEGRETTPSSNFFWASHFRPSSEVPATAEDAKKRKPTRATKSEREDIIVEGGL
jgi:hypothetical protein